MKYFYKSMMEDIVTGLTSSPYPIKVKGLIPITEDEFNQLIPQMGTPWEEDPYAEKEDPYAEMAKAIREGVNEV